MAAEKNPATKMWEAHIDGKLFEFEKYGALEATQLLFDLGAITGKPLGGMAAKATGQDGTDGATAAKANAFSMVIEKLTDALSTHRELAIKLLTKLSSGDRIMCDGRKVGDYNTFYAEDLMLAFDVARTNLEVQFGNFFSAASRRLGLNLSEAQPAISGTISNG